MIKLERFYVGFVNIEFFPWFLFHLCWSRQKDWTKTTDILSWFHYSLNYAESRSFWVFRLIINQKFGSPITWRLPVRDSMNPIGSFDQIWSPFLTWNSTFKHSYKACKNHCLSLTMTFKIFLFSQLKILSTTRWMLLLLKTINAKIVLLWNFSYKLNTFSIVLGFSLVLSVFSTNFWEVGGGLLLSS